MKNDIRNLVNFHVSRQKSKNVHFDVFLLLIADKVSAIKSREELFLMTQNFDKKLAFCLKNDMRNLVNFDSSLKMYTFNKEELRREKWLMVSKMT